MHIGFFADSYLPYTSGVVRSIITFTKELQNLGHQVSIFAPSYGNDKHEQNVFRFRSLRAPTFREFAVALPFSPSLLNKLKNLELDLIHVHSPFTLGRLGARAAKQLGLPLVATYHTLYEEYVHYFPIAPSIMRKLIRNYTISFCNRCQLVITPTETIASYLREGGIIVPVTSVPTGIEIERFNKADKSWLRNYLRIPQDKILLLHVGRLGKEKNITFVLESFAVIHKQLPNTHLVFVGSGPLKDTLQNMTQSLSINEAVTFAGSFTFEQMPNVYAGADLFIFASVTETQGLVIGEAKAAGLPVVAVEAYGVKEMVVNGEDGFLTPLMRETYCNSIIKLVSNPTLRRQMGLQARQNAKNLSSLEMARRLAALYETLV